MTMARRQLFFLSAAIFPALFFSCGDSRPKACPACGHCANNVPGAAATACAKPPAHAPQDSAACDAKKNRGQEQLVNVRRRTLKRDIQAEATVCEDERRVAMVAARGRFFIEKIYANATGTPVEKNQVLCDIGGPEIAALLSRCAANDAAGDSLASDKKNALEQLLRLGIDDADVAAAIKKSTTRTLPLRSPTAGVIAVKSAIEGEFVEPGAPLFKIVDFSTVWVVAEVFQQEIPLVKPGADVRIVIYYLEGRSFPGKISWVAPELSEHDRSMRVRVELPNTKDCAIKPGMKATMIIAIPVALNVLALPDTAIFYADVRPFVLVREGNASFSAAPVVVGVSSEGYTEITAGVSEGDAVALSPQTVIDTYDYLRDHVSHAAKAAGTGAN